MGSLRSETVNHKNEYRHGKTKEETLGSKVQVSADMREMRTGVAIPEPGGDSEEP